MTALLPGKILEAERAVLGGLMLSPDAIDDIAEIVTASDFYRDAHGKLLELLVEMREKGEPLDMVAVVARVGFSGNPGEYGGLSYISQLPDNVPSTENIEYYAELVADFADTRRVLQQLQEAEEGLKTGAISTVQARESCAKIADSGRERAESHTDMLGDVLDDVMADAEAEAAGERASFYGTGIIELDEQPDFCGVSREGVTLVIGQSGMGKTSYLNRLALGLAYQGLSVLLYGTETDKMRRAKDLLNTLAGLDVRRWKRVTRDRHQAKQQGLPLPHETFTRESMARLRWAAALLRRLPIEVCNSGWTIDHLCLHAKRRFRQGRLDVVIADYLQDFVMSDKVEASMSRQVSYSSKRFKDLCSKLKIPGIMGAQRSGEKEQKILRWKPSRDEPSPPGHRYLIPQMHEVQWASAAFHDAEEVFVLYRPLYFIERYPEVHANNPFNWDCDEDQLKLVCRKARSSSLAEWHTRFTGHCKWVGDRPRDWVYAA